MAYNIISLENMYKAIGEEKLKKILNKYKCNYNKDVEYFLKEKAIQFLKMGIAKTFLVTTSYKEKQIIVGYFSLANKVIKIKIKLLSYSLKKRMSRFNENHDTNDYFIISLPLIGQLGKNFENNYNTLIDGDLLLKFACEKVKEAQSILGGKFVFLECEDKPQLREFYERNGFVCFGKRNLERDEREKNQGEYLLQMLCDLRNN